MFMLKTFMLTLIAAGLAAQDSKQPVPVKALQEAKPEALTDAVARLDGEVAQLKREKELMWETLSGILKSRHITAEFDPSSPNLYQAIETGSGPLLFEVGKSEPYLDGYKVEVKIGNPMAMTYKGVEFSVFWAPRIKEKESWPKWFNARRSRLISRTESLLPGRFVTVEVILPDTKAEQFGYLGIESVSVNRIGFQ